MGLRRNSRERALKALYLVDLSEFSIDEALGIVNRPESDSSGGDKSRLGEAKEFTETLVKGTIENKAMIDKLIVKHTNNWELNRMSTIDRNIIRLATYEITKMLETPINVIINEAIEIAKKYSAADAGGFVNGVLDKIKQARKK